MVSRIFIAVICLLPATAMQAQSSGRDSSYTGQNIFSFQPKRIPTPASPKIQLVQYPASLINPGFFCRQELKLDRRTPLPLRFRLGSLQYCNWLEQKPGYRNWQGENGR